MSKIKRELPPIMEIIQWKLYARGKYIRKSKHGIIKGINEKLDARVKRATKKGESHER